MNVKKSLLLLNILLTGLVLWTGFKIYDTWASHKRLEKRSIAADLDTKGVEKPGTRKFKKRSDYRFIVSRDIFKTTAKPSRRSMAQKIDVGKLKENTRFELMGTVVGEDGNSYAIIREKNKKEQDLYALDDAIDDVKISQILSDRVVIEKDGTEEVLVISHERGRAPRMSKPVKRPIAYSQEKKRIMMRKSVQPRKRPVKGPAKDEGLNEE